MVRKVLQPDLNIIDQTMTPKSSDLGVSFFLKLLISNLDLFSLGEATTLERDHSEVAGMESLSKIRLLQ